MTKKGLRHCSFLLFGGLLWVLGGQLGFWLEGPGARLGILGIPPAWVLFGGLSFLGFWEHPKMKFSSKSRPCVINLGLF